MNELLIVNGLTKHFKNRCVLSDVDFTARRGEMLGLIGPNGAGKTTLFECLAGLMPADAGVVKSDKILPSSTRLRIFSTACGSSWPESRILFRL